MSEIFGMADAYKSAQSRSEYGMSTMNMDISVVIDMIDEIESLRAQVDKAHQQLADLAEDDTAKWVRIRELEAQSGEAVGEVMRFEEIIYAELTAPTTEMVGAKIYLAPPAAKVPDCVWRCDNDDSSLWIGSCGASWFFESGGPVENEQDYCPCCGAKCIAAAQEGENHES